VVQFRSSGDLTDNAKRHCDFIRSCAKEGARVVVFPEYSLTSGVSEVIGKTSPAQLAEAEATIGAACREANAYAIVGSPTKTAAELFNSALVFTPAGKVIERYHKVQLAESWPRPGDHLSVFPIDGVWCSIIICHDERYPELVRLPVLAGARLVFYISSESGIEEESKMVPYRAQIMARAEENSVYIAHANTPANKKDLSGSHGESRLINTDGNIIKEASVFNEEVLSTTFDMARASGGLARRSAACPFLAKWWTDGAALVRRIEG
jgi:predicted amidohydrolase